MKLTESMAKVRCKVLSSNSTLRSVSPKVSEYTMTHVNTYKKYTVPFAP